MEARIARNRRFLTDLFSGPFPGHAIILGPPVPPTPHPGDITCPDTPLSHWLDRGLRNYEAELRYLQALDDDSVPSIKIHTGTQLFAAAFGCPIHIYEDSNPAALPLVTTAAESDALRVPSLDAEPLARAMEYGRLMRERVGPDVPVRVPDIQSPFDIAALIWRKQDFYLAMLDHPEAVKRLVDNPAMLEAANMAARLRDEGMNYVAIGRALVREPKVFLFDEPLSNLDAKLRVQMRAEIASLQQQLGITTVYVTHDQKEALSVADRLAVMRDGVIEQTGTPEEVYRAPVSRFVAGFIGEGTFIDGQIEALEERGLHLTRLSPHLVKPVPFLYPLKHHWERPYVGSGLILYDALAMAGKYDMGVPKHKHLFKKQVARIAQNGKVFPPSDGNWRNEVGQTADRVVLIGGGIIRTTGRVDELTEGGRSLEQVFLEKLTDSVDYRGRTR